MKKRSLNILFSLLSLTCFNAANAAQCTVNFTLDPSVWRGGKWSAFFIEHPGNTVSNMITYDGTCPTTNMQATFNCSKTTYLEIHVIKLDQMTAAFAGNTGFEYWSRCFGMIPEYNDQQTNTLRFPSLRGSRTPGSTNDHFRYDSPPDCLPA